MKFYSSFAAKDIEGMLSCYHNEIEFEDPAFGKLHREKAAAMWRMLLDNPDSNLKISYSDIEAEGNLGSAKWTATYNFGKQRRKVYNVIKSKFEFTDGKIIRHHDNFNLHKWATQALGLQGLMLGWTGYFKHKMNERTAKILEAYIKKDQR